MAQLEVRPEVTTEKYHGHSKGAREASEEATADGQLKELESEYQS